MKSSNKYESQIISIGKQVIFKKSKKIDIPNTNVSDKISLKQHFNNIFIVLLAPKITIKTVAEVKGAITRK